jgi:hypothetical protein
LYYPGICAVKMNYEDHDIVLFNLLESSMIEVCHRFESPLPVCYRKKIGGNLIVGIAFAQDQVLPCPLESEAIEELMNLKIVDHYPNISNIHFVSYVDNRNNFASNIVRAVEISITYDISH